MHTSVFNLPLKNLVKYSFLEYKIAADKSDPIIIKKNEAFGPHSNKTERAWVFLDKKYRTIFDEGVWEDGIWEKGVWLENTYAKYQT